MDKNKTVGWLMVAYGGWSLLIGIVTNDMGGLASLGYNTDLPMSFGPLQNQGGERRLNVLITRSKEQCIVSFQDSSASKEASDESKAFVQVQAMAT